MEYYEATKRIGNRYSIYYVDGAENFAQFPVQAIGAREIGRSVVPSGVIANLQLKIGNVSLMISEANKDYPPSSAAYYIYVENAYAAMEKAISAGATLEMEVADIPYDDRQGGVRDSFGNIWWISQRMIDAPYH